MKEYYSQTSQQQQQQQQQQRPPSPTPSSTSYASTSSRATSTSTSSTTIAAGWEGEQDIWTSVSSSGGPLSEDCLHLRLPIGGLFRDLIDATPSHCVARAISEEFLCETWHHGRTVLIGDGRFNNLKDIKSGYGGSAIRRENEDTQSLNLFFLDLFSSPLIFFIQLATDYFQTLDKELPVRCRMQSFLRIYCTVSLRPRQNMWSSFSRSFSQIVYRSQKPKWI